MQKCLFKTRKGFYLWLDVITKDIANLIVNPISYPCVVCYYKQDIDNGKDWLEYEYVYLKDFETDSQLDILGSE